jgi:hypothetical protein
MALYALRIVRASNKCAESPFSPINGLKLAMVDRHLIYKNFV